MNIRKKTAALSAGLATLVVVPMWALTSQGAGKALAYWLHFEAKFLAGGYDADGVTHAQIARWGSSSLASASTWSDWLLLSLLVAAAAVAIYRAIEAVAPAQQAPLSA